MITRLPAVALDAFNVGVVRWRVGRRQPRVSRPRLERLLEEAASDPLEGIGTFDVQPRRATQEGMREQWRDPGSDWVCERHRARGARTASLVLLHGWLATRAQFDFIASLARPLLEAGIDIWMPWLPDHGPRTPDDTVSGARCISADLETTCGAIRRGVGETRSLIGRLRRRDQPIGLWGVSLGGWVAALTAASGDPLDALLLWAPVADPFDALWRSPITRDVRNSLQKADIGPELTRRAFGPFAPSARRNATSPHRTLVMGGVYDNVVSKRSLDALAISWKSTVRWYPHGHISMLCSSRARADARAWMRSTLV